MEDDPDPTMAAYNVGSAVDDAYQKWNQYWIKTDLHTEQVLVTILDSRMKLQLCKNLQCEASWIENP